jgi:integrase
MDTSTALVRLEPSGEVALPAELVDQTNAYMKEARSERTREAYRLAWKFFDEWCTANGRCALPASPETLAAWATALADGVDKPNAKPRARNTISQYVAGVLAAQRAAGYAVDRQNAVLKNTLAGISRKKARTETVRKAAPLLGKDLHPLLRMLDAGKAKDCRDGALLALGWSGAMRRSEIVGLDWQQIGEGRGFVRIDDRGVEIVLMRSKASQDAAVTLAIPATDMPSAVEWLQAWVQAANSQPGEPGFKAVNSRQQIAPERLRPESVNLVVKARVARYAKAKGKSKKEAAELARQFSGHSMRAGFATSAADNDVGLSQLATHTRHKSLETLQGYVRSSEQWRKSPLKGLGF